MSNDTTPQPEYKTCTKCGKALPARAEFFYRSKTAPDGLAWYCKECSKAQDRLRSQPDYEGQHARRAALLASGLQECAKCHETKPLDEFSQGAQTLSGRKSWCKRCYAEQMGWEYCPRTVYPEAPDGYKYCTQCEQLTPLREFWRETRNIDGYNYHCKACVRKQLGTAAREDLPEGMARCGRCLRVLPADERYFNKGYKRDGTTSYCKDCLREWRVENRARLRGQNLIHANLRRARKLQLPANFTEMQWGRALEYFGYRCAVCGRPAGLWHFLAQDHWIPITSKRKDNPGTTALNVLPLCHGEGGCNSKKSNKEPEAWLDLEFGKRKAKRILKRVAAYFEWVRKQDSDK